ncbi:DoxX family protein [Chitinophagaceae bacterium MMS25-I14]
MNTEKPLAYLFLRLITGINFLMHGMVRIPKLSIFSSWMTEQFAHTFLPPATVTAFAHILPFGEALTGLLLISGLFTRKALVLASVIIAMLVTGSTLIENWEIVGIQMIYATILFALFFLSAYNTYSLDSKILKR